MADLTSPVFSLSRGWSGGIRNWFKGDAEKKVRALEDERVRLMAELSRRDAVLSENEVLREALALRKEGESGVIPAGVAAFFREGRDEFLTLDRGAASGIAAGDIILSKSRVFAGVVVDTGANFSRVALATSPSRSVDVVIGEKLRAIARGANSRELVIDFVPQDAEVKTGDLVRVSARSTAGQGSFLIGEVREVQQAEHEVFKVVRAVHLFDPAEDEVLILLAP